MNKKELKLIKIMLNLPFDNNLIKAMDELLIVAEKNKISKDTYANLISISQDKYHIWNAYFNKENYNE